MDDFVKIDLKFGMPAEIGMTFSGPGMTKTKSYSSGDVPAILKVIDGIIQTEKQKQKADSVKLYLKGNSTETILMMLTAGIIGRTDVSEFWYEKPYSLPNQIFPLPESSAENV